MTNLVKLASKYAKDMGNRPELLVRDAIVRALKELETRVVLDVKRSSPGSALVADRIIRNRPLPYPRAYSTQGAHVRDRIEYKDIIIYAIEQGRELERRERQAHEHTQKQLALPAEREFGWHWNESPHQVFPIFGSHTLESARRAMDNVLADGTYKIVMRDHARPGEWEGTR